MTFEGASMDASSPLALDFQGWEGDTKRNTDLIF
jgi:hypothetical protein